MDNFPKQLEREFQAAVAEAIERHRRLGQSIAVWKDGAPCSISAEEIPAYLKEMEEAKKRESQDSDEPPDAD